jgi:acylphosphatase
VRNLDDGRVEAFAQGTVALLDELQGLLWRGPRVKGGPKLYQQSGVKVDQIEVSR